jgi:hypothetical protein
MESEGGLMSEPREHEADEMPSNEELEEPSTEKDPGEEPKVAHPSDPEPDHHAVGIGVIDSEPSEGTENGSSTEGGSPPHPTAAQMAEADSDLPTTAVENDVAEDAAEASESGG